METFIWDIITSFSIFAPLSTVVNEDIGEWNDMHLQTNT